MPYGGAVLIADANLKFLAHETGSYRVGQTHRFTSDVFRRWDDSMIFHARCFCRCFSFSSLAKCCGVCHVDAEKRAAESRCGSCVPLSGQRRSVVSDCRSCLHCGRAQSPDYSSGCACVSIFILGLRAFAENRSLCVFGAIPPVVVVGIDGVCSDFGHFGVGQFLLIFNAIL